MIEPFREGAGIVVFRSAKERPFAKPKAMQIVEQSIKKEKGGEDWYWEWVADSLAYATCASKTGPAR